jgi:hypothetical protein
LTNGTYFLTQFPSQEELEGYTAYYMGGCNHTGITEGIRTAMIADGIVTSANFTVE